MSAATIGKAAELGSPGMSMACALSSRWPSIAMWRPSSRFGSIRFGAEGLQHALGMIAGGDRLDHRGAARAFEAGQQHRRFDLRRGDGQRVGDGHAHACAP